MEVGSLKTHRYNAAGDVTILDNKRIKISDMTYNGKSLHKTKGRQILNVKTINLQIKRLHS